MKLPRCNWVGFFILLTLLSCGAAAPDLKPWRCGARIESPGDHRYKTLFLPEAVYANARPDLADLRILDAGNQWVPYLVVNGYGAESEKRTVYQAQLIKEFKKDGNSFYDFRVAPLLQAADIVGNQLQLELPAVNFLKNIEVYGGYDGKLWEKLGSDQIYRVDDLVKDKINLAASQKYTYYRIVLLSNADSIRPGGLRLIDRNLQTNWTSFQKATPVRFELANKTAYTLITIKNPQHLKLKRIIIGVTGNFRREFQVFTDPELKQPVTVGEIFNLKFQDVNISETGMALPDMPPSDPVIWVKIINHDNRPLQISKIQTEYYIDQIIFENPDNQAYRLCFGNRDAQQPVYDLESFRTHLLKEPKDAANLQDIQITVPKPALAKTQSNLALVFNLVLLAVSLLLIIFIIGRLNGQKV